MTFHHARDPEELLASGLSVIDIAFEHGATSMYPLLSGGNDSQCACVVASQHPRFDGNVHHIDTGIGAKACFDFVKELCDEWNWNLCVYQSAATYERFIRRLGFPGPGSHQWVYNWLKDRCIGRMTKGSRKALITGCRQQESTRRMGHTEKIKIGETSKKTGKVTKTNRVWTAPCYDWSGEEQIAFMNAWGLSSNPIKKSPIGMSGECFCGAFARPYELEMIRQFAPDVAEEIDRLQQIAKECGTPCEWGKRPKGQRGIVTVRTGPLCSGCDRRAAAAGVLFADMD